MRDARLGRQHNLTRPILRLPRELLLEILELNAPIPQNTWLCTASRTDAPRYEWSESDYYSFCDAFGKTCSDFHSLLQSSKSPWAFVSLRVRSSTNATPLHAFERCLQRSSPSPFHLKIDFDLETDDFSAQSYNKALQPHLSRCHTLLVRCRGHYSSFFWNLLDVSELPNLKNFQFTWIDECGVVHREYVSPATYLWPEISTCWPKLETLTICDYLGQRDVATETFRYYLPFAPSLVRLRIAGPYSSASIISFLTNCLCLEHFEWIPLRKAPPNSAIAPGKVLRLSNLRSLAVTGRINPYYFPPIDAPLLEVLRLSHDGQVRRGRQDRSHHAVNVFHPDQPHLPHLKYVMFDPTMYPPASVSRFLDLHTTIEDIYITNEVLTGFKDTETQRLVGTLDALKALRPSSAAASIDHPHPRLKRLFIALTGSHEKNPGTFRALKKALRHTSDILNAPLIYATYSDEHIEKLFNNDEGSIYNLTLLYDLDNVRTFEKGWPFAWALCEVTMHSADDDEGDFQ
ncbi:hypothetical protein DL93DRAFT_2173865 [Clavulina sp. PMI_390]|nr:hypothetical protein DL93DRAFT_2173865 [Clavulina sp. PMI_390]